MNEYDDQPVGYEDDPERDAIIARAKSKTKAPAILLIVFGVITVLGGLRGVMGLQDFDQKMDDVTVQNNEKIDSDPQLSDDQKKEVKGIVAKWMDVIRVIVPPIIFTNVGVGLLLVVGGLCLKQLSAAWLVVLACLLGMVPLTTFCCTGFPFGLWALIVLRNADVRAGYQAKAMGM